MSRYDEYNDIHVDQMVANNISGKVMEKTVLCLNARRETRRLTAVTNETVLLFTNAIVTTVTNRFVSIATNYSATAMTNAMPLAVLTPIESAPTATGTNVAAESVVQLPSGGATSSTNASAAAATNQTLVLGPGQITRGIQISRNSSDQVTTTVNNWTVMSVHNLLLTAETNWAVNYTTNYQVTAVTNISIMPTSTLVYAYYLYTELLAPADFNYHNGESLVLIVDGKRHGFSASHARDPFVGRKGYLSTLYAVPPNVLVAIANAQEVKVRVNGTSSIIEKKMTASSRRHFRSYLLKNFQPDATPEGKSRELRGPESPQAAQAAFEANPAASALRATCVGDHPL